MDHGHGPSFYWPVCAQSSTVDRWFEDAEILEWHKELSYAFPKKL
jgi:hypothetical protein